MAAHKLTCNKCKSMWDQIAAIGQSPIEIPGLSQGTAEHLMVPMQLLCTNHVLSAHPVVRLPTWKQRRWGGRLRPGCLGTHENFFDISWRCYELHNQQNFAACHVCRG